MMYIVAMKITVIEQCLQEINKLDLQIQNEIDDATIVLLKAKKDEKRKELESLIKSQNPYMTHNEIAPYETNN
jgi:hypothetical protein